MISFIVPAHNEEQLLPATLTAIHDAARKVGGDYEILVIDDASTDRTPEVAIASGARLIKVNHRQIAATRNSGAAVARGELLIFVDADTVISQSLLRSALAAVKRGAVGGGAEVEYDGEVPFYARVLLPVVVVLYCRVARLAGGCFFFCTRTAFDSAGGFDEHLYASEEVALSRALKREGEFVILRQPVTTSGRKFRTYSGFRVLATLGRLFVKGPKAVRSRKDLDLWYRDRESEEGNCAHPPR